MGDILRKVTILIIVLAFSYYLSVFAGDLYEKLFPGPTSILGAVDLRSVIGIPLAYIFFLTLLFTAFGDSKKYWWIGILLIPAVAFELYFDLQHIYFPIFLGLLGWALGLGIKKLL